MVLEMVGMINPSRGALSCELANLKPLQQMSLIILHKITTLVGYFISFMFILHTQTHVQASSVLKYVPHRKELYMFTCFDFKPLLQIDVLEDMTNALKQLSLYNI